jgi:predicted kinase
VLLVINGAPGVGKSTLARLFADEHALALVIDIDAIRTSLGKWAEFEESKLVARDLAIAMIHVHLLAGHDVIVPQYFGRPEFVERLRNVAAETGAEFAEVVLTDENEEIAERFRRRRAEYAAAGIAHPESDVPDDAIAAAVLDANAHLVRDATARGVLVIPVGRGPEAAYEILRRTVAASS